MLMRTVCKAFAYSCLTIVSGLAFSAPNPGWFQDPVFGLVLNVSKSRLDPAPPRVVALCAELFSEEWDRRSWVFATAQDGPHSYYLIGGFWVRRSTGQFERDTRGAIVEIIGEKCTAIGPARETFDYEMEEITPMNRANLAADAVARLSVAIGGRKELAAEMRRQHIKPPDKNSLLEKVLSNDGTHP